MIFLNITIRCDHPGCGQETQATLRPLPPETAGPFPFLPPEAPPGWTVPRVGQSVAAPCACPTHSEEQKLS